MRILYLIYAQQNSFSAFSSNARTKCSWVDAILDELEKCKNITIALAVPVNTDTFQKSQKNGITLFGLPNPKERNFFKKVHQRIKHSSENVKINSYAIQAISEFKPDIIQIFGSENPFGLILMKPSPPVVLHIQGSSIVVLGKWFIGISKWQQFRYASLKSLILMQGTYHESVTFKKRADREAVILKNCKYFMGRTNFDKRIVSLLSPDSTYFHCEEFIRKEFFRKQWNF